MEYTGTCSIQEPGVYRTLEYTGPWSIQEPEVYRNLKYIGTWSIQEPGVYRNLEYIGTRIRLNKILFPSFLVEQKLAAIYIKSIDGSSIEYNFIIKRYWIYRKVWAGGNIRFQNLIFLYFKRSF